MKKVGKPVFFIVAFLIVFLFVTAVFGISSQYGDWRSVYIKGGNDIRWGIDIRGGVDVTFTPAKDKDCTEEELEAAKKAIDLRLSALNITDHELYIDSANDSLILRFPWKENEKDFDPQKAINEIGTTSKLVFRKGETITGEQIMEGKNVKKAEVVQDSQRPGNYAVSFVLDKEGAAAFKAATSELLNKGSISIWLDEQNVSTATVSAVISDTGQITGNFTYEDADTLARKISYGALPYEMKTENFSTISPSMGGAAKDAMVLGGLIALIAVCIFMIARYRLPGFVASLAIIGQVAGSIMAVSGYLPNLNSFTLTLPGIAGIILGIGMGVDANIITASRIQEELNNGRSLDGAIDAGFHRAFSAILDGNVSVLIVAAILMGAFGPSSNAFAVVFSPIFRWFGAATTGIIYSFGYTLFINVILNFVFGVLASRLMLKSLSGFKCFRKAAYYGGAKNEEE